MLKLMYLFTIDKLLKNRFIFILTIIILLNNFHIIRFKKLFILVYLLVTV